LEMVSRAHMVHPQYYISDCRKYRGHLTGPSSALRCGTTLLYTSSSAQSSTSSSIAPSSTSPASISAPFNSSDFEKTRKLLASTFGIMRSKVPKTPADVIPFLATREFGGPLENVLKQCPTLPLEVLANIFRRLPTRISSHMSVCTHWATAAMIPDIWASHIAIDFPRSVPEIPIHAPETIRLFYIELVHRELGDPVVFDVGAAKVRCGSLTDYMIAAVHKYHSASADSSLVEESSSSGFDGGGGGTDSSTAGTTTSTNNNNNNGNNNPSTHSSYGATMAMSASSTSPQHHLTIGRRLPNDTSFFFGGGSFINAHTDLAPSFIYQSAVRRAISKRK